MEKLEPSYIAGRNVKMIWLLWKRGCQFLKKLNIELPYDPVVSLLGRYPKELKTGTQRITCTLLFRVALFTITKRWKWLKSHSGNEWISKLWYIHTMGLLFSHKKE